MLKEDLQVSKMPVGCFKLGIPQARIFFSFCCVFSLLIVVVTVGFFYYPEGLGISSGTINFEQQPRRPGLREFVGRPKSVQDSDELFLLMEPENMMDYHLKTSEAEDELVQMKLRHHAHHHGKAFVSLEELEQTSLLSNVVESRLMHLDLKGAPPKVAYLKEVMKLAKRAGINGLLVEWEDTFPWKDELSNLTLLDGGYNREEVEELINYAELVMDFDVIPLVQTFGHAEFILKGQQYKHLREVDADPQSYCPTKGGTMEVIKEMIDQIIEVHTNARYIHIGCDEVYNLRVCPLCTAASELKEDTFLKHVTAVASYVRLKGRIPIIWDDMLRSIPSRKLSDSGLGRLVEPMVWVYAEDVDRFVGYESWEKYAEVFPSIWGAAAFKGAFGESLSIVPLSRHADNIDRWVNVITRESPKWEYGVAGIVLTGWQRYDHFSVLCELLPASIPSLIYGSLLTSVPSSSVTSIKNRVFVPKYPENPESDVVEQIVISSSAAPSLPSSSSALSSPIPSASSQSEEMEVPLLLPLRARRSSPNYHRKISHPRILMTKDRLSTLVSHGPKGELGPGEVFSKADHISREFCQILHCPSHHTRIDVLLKGTDRELNFASRGSWSGVAFFRALFRLKGLLADCWEMVAKINRKRGWVTKYNVRHNYSLPLRVDEVVFAEVPRLRRQLEVTVRGIEASLKPIFRQEIILEWIEQNAWEVWKKLKEFEKNGEILKNIGVWGRRPLQTPWEMVADLKLSDVEHQEQEEL